MILNAIYALLLLAAIAGYLVGGPVLLAKLFYQNKWSESLFKRVILFWYVFWPAYALVAAVRA